MESLPKSLASVATIEGASGTGKTTLLRGLAHRYSCEVIEVGVIVRALAWWAQRNRVSIPDAVAALAALDSGGALAIGVGATRMAAMELVLRGTPLGDETFEPRLAAELKAAALDQLSMDWVHALVRERLRGHRGAISGREVATRTVPGARVVLRLVAHPKVRRDRKLAQLRGAGLPADWHDDVALLPKATMSAIVLDTTALSAECLLDRVGRLAEARLGWPRASARGLEHHSGSLASASTVIPASSFERATRPPAHAFPR